MSNWSLPAVGGHGIDNFIDSSDYYLAVAAGSANSKGSWVELTSSLARPAYGLLLMWGSILGSTEDGHLIDFGVGGSGSEVVVTPDLLHATDNNGVVYRMRRAFLPQRIPSGTRVACRVQSEVASSSYIRVSGFALSSPLLAGTRCTAYGLSTSVSEGTTLTADSTQHVKGAWAELTSSTANPIRFLMIAFGSARDAGRPNTRFLVDVAVGGSGSEEVILSNLFCCTRSFNNQTNPEIIGPFAYGIPSGTRIAARCACATASEPVSLVVYGFH